MAYFIGIDGGGTKTACLVGDESRVLGSATAGGCSIVRLGEQTATRNLHTAINEACEQARISPAQVASVCLGSAGVSATDSREKLQSILGEVVTGRVSVVGDMDIALEAAFGDGPGVVVIAGTGSIAFGRHQDGRTARAGGWGHAICDEGSGHWMGREAVHRALHAWTSHESALPTLVREAWNVQTPDEVVRIANGSPPPDFAALFPALVKSASAGDGHARLIIQDAAIDLAALAYEVIGQLWGADNDTVRVAFAGGVFHASDVVRDELFAFLEQSRATVQPMREPVNPVLGALALARKAVPAS